MLSSISLACAGLLAMEKARGWLSPGICRLMYCPAWKVMGASSSIHTPLMVGVRSSMRETTPAKSCTGRFSAPGSSSISASITALSDSSVAQQARHRPSSRS